MLILLLAGCPHPPPPAEATVPWEVERLAAFAELYGMVRWFHPTDAAAEADWDAIAATGAWRVQQAADPEALAEVLVDVFDDVATVQVWTDAAPAPPVLPAGPPVAWAHYGLGTTDAYVSWREGVEDPYFDIGAEVCGYRFDLPGSAKDVAMSAWVRADSGTAWLAIGDARVESTSAEWTRLELRGSGPVSVGGDLPNPVWVDEIELVVDGVPVPASLEGEAAGWETLDWCGGSDAQSDRGVAVRIPGFSLDRTGLPDLTTAPTMEGPIGAGLHARVPRVLPLVDGHPYGPIEPPVVTGERDDVRAATVVAWASMRHFFPTAREAGVDWNPLLHQALAASLAPGAGPHDGVWTVTGALRDGHVSMWLPGDGSGFWPVQLGWVEAQVVVTESRVDTVLPGDVVVAVDGEPVATRFEQLLARTSGSPQFRTARAAMYVGMGDGVSKVVLRRGDAEVEVELGREDFQLPIGPPPLERLPDGVYVVNLQHVTPDELQASLAEIAAAPGVVFDARMYPGDASDLVLRHLLREPEHALWNHTAMIVRPHQAGVTWRSEGWHMEPAEPRIAGKVAWLTSPNAISYAESILGYVAAYDLGARFGGPTAGANGNVNVMSLPDGTAFTFSGMRVSTHAGADQQTIGIPPTHPVEPTIAGLHAGRDEVLEAALAWVRAPE